MTVAHEVRLKAFRAAINSKAERSLSFEAVYGMAVVCLA